MKLTFYTWHVIPISYVGFEMIKQTEFYAVLQVKARNVPELLRYANAS
jgi:hypothetical protein